MFKNIDALVAFHKGFDGHMFRDKQGPSSLPCDRIPPLQKLTARPDTF